MIQSAICLSLLGSPSWEGTQDQWIVFWWRDICWSGYAICDFLGVWALAYSVHISRFYWYSVWCILGGDMKTLCGIKYSMNASCSPIYQHIPTLLTVTPLLTKFPCIFHWLNFDQTPTKLFCTAKFGGLVTLKLMLAGKHFINEQPCCEIWTCTSSSQSKWRCRWLRLSLISVTNAEHFEEMLSF